MWFRGAESVDSLIARQRYDRAIKLLERSLRAEPKNVAVRQRLADVLGRAGRPDRAVAVLAPLVEQFSAEGSTAKAIALLKKIRRLDPKRTDIDRLVARLERQSDVVMAIDTAMACTSGTSAWKASTGRTGTRSSAS